MNFLLRLIAILGKAISNERFYYWPGSFGADGPKVADVVISGPYST